MRITQGMISNNMLNNLTKSYSQLNKYMDQLNTGMKITKPSDDPFIAVKGLSYRSQVVRVQQYKSNTNEAHQWLDNSDTALNGATQALQRLKDLAIQGANDPYNAEQRKNIREEVEQLKKELIDLTNTKLNDKYIFNGTDTTNPPATIAGDGSVTVNTTQKPVEISVSDNIELPVNVDGGKVFGGDFFARIDKFISALDNNDQAGIDTAIGDMDKNIDSVVNARAELGARMNRLDLIEDRLSQQEINAKDIMSKNENVDYEKAITDLLTQETMHRAALAAGSRVIQPSLVDFLR